MKKKIICLLLCVFIISVSSCNHNSEIDRFALVTGIILKIQSSAVAKMYVSDQFPHNKKWKVKWENLNSYVE